MNLAVFQKKLRSEGISQAIILNVSEDMLCKPNPNYIYFTNVFNHGACIIPASSSSKPTLIISHLDEVPHKSGWKVLRFKNWQNFLDLIVKQLRGKTIGLEMVNCSAQFYRAIRKKYKAQWKDLSDMCAKQRALKTSKELAIMKQGCKVSDEILQSCIDKFKRFRTERDVCMFLGKQAQQAGVGYAFHPIIASGPGAASPHYVPKNNRLHSGFCVIDFGIRYKGYCTDTTRTIFLGKPSQKEKKIYDMVLKAQKLLCDQSQPGTKCSFLYDEAKTYLGPYAKYFIHGLGHGVGMQIHEWPSLSAPSKAVLAKNMVITIEPGVYIPKKLGIRIEDTLIVDKKPKILTNISKELVVIK